MKGFQTATIDRISAKINITRDDFKKAVDSVNNSGGRCVVFTFYSLCQSSWGSSPAVNIILNSIDSQDDTLQDLTQPLHISYQATDELGLAIITKSPKKTQIQAMMQLLTKK